MAEKTYIVNHTLLGGGYGAGELITPYAGIVKNADGTDRDALLILDKNTQRGTEIDLPRLLRLDALRVATDDEINATAAGLPPDSVVMGNVPDGYARVSMDTFAQLDPATVANAGGNQSDVGKAAGKQAKAAALSVPAGMPQSDQPPS